jgi:hypothetical protein
VVNVCDIESGKVRAMRELMGAGQALQNVLIVAADGKALGAHHAFAHTLPPMGPVARGLIVTIVWMALALGFTEIVSSTLEARTVPLTTEPS